MSIETPATLLTAELRSFLSADPPRHATIATINPDGGPHQIVVWFSLRGDEIVVNSRHGRRWPSNLRRDARASVAVHDGDDAVTIGCLVDRTYEGEDAQEDIAEMARRYYTAESAEHQIERFRTERRLSFVLRPVRVHVHGEPR